MISPISNTVSGIMNNRFIQTSIKKKLSGILLSALTLVFLFSCSATIDESALSSFAPSAKLVLNQELTIPANKTGVYIQYGKVVTYPELDQYYPNCRLIVNDLKTTSQTVQADEFSITHIMFIEDYTNRPYPLYASLSNIPLLAEGPTPEDYATIFSLHSEKQPNVKKLVCTHLEDPPIANHLTPAQIRTALGEIMTLK